MSRNLEASINVPFTTLTGNFTGHNGVEYSYGTLAETLIPKQLNHIPEPQNKPLIQTGGEMNEIDAIKEQAAKEECINLTGKPCPDEPESKPALPKTDTIFTRDGELISKTIDSPKIEKPVSEKNEPNNATITNDDIEQRHLNKTYEGAYRDGDEQMPLGEERIIVVQNEGRNIVPHSEHLGVGIGLALASAAGLSYIHRDKIDARFPGIKRTVLRAKSSLRYTRLKYKFDLNPDRTLDDIQKENEVRNPLYAQIAATWEPEDYAVLLHLARDDRRHGIILVDMMHKIIASLLTVSDEVRPRDVVERLNMQIDHFGVPRKDRWSLIEVRPGKFVLDVAGNEYSLESFSKQIRKEIEADHKKGIAETAKIDPVVSE